MNKHLKEFKIISESIYNIGSTVFMIMLGYFLVVILPPLLAKL